MQKDVNFNTDGSDQPKRAVTGLAPLHHQACFSALICNLGRFPAQMSLNTDSTTLWETRAVNVLFWQLSSICLWQLWEISHQHRPCRFPASHHASPSQDTSSDALMAVTKQRWGRNITTDWKGPLCLNLIQYSCVTHSEAVFFFFGHVGHLSGEFSILGGFYLHGQLETHKIKLLSIKNTPQMSSCCGFKTHRRLCF